MQESNNKQVNIHWLVGRQQNHSDFFLRAINEAISQRSEDKCLIKIKKYIALFVVYDLSLSFSERIFMFPKGLKQEKIFYN